MNADAVETILADFRAWLNEAAEAPALEPKADFDVAGVLQHFIALRQEVNLQTKSSRAQLEQNGQALALLQQSLETLQRKPGDEDAKEDALRPLLKTLIDAHDALMLGQREVQRLLADPPVPPRQEVPAPHQELPPPTVKIRLPFWVRWLGLDVSIERQVARALKRRIEPPPTRLEPPPTDDDLALKFRQVLDALLVGYRMSLQRIERTFEQQGLEAIPCVGEPFDPEIMEVAEVVREEGRTSTEVLQEIRRGYRWRGKLFRYAQVRVAKP